MPSADLGFCPTCGLPNPLAASRCSSCGAKLGAATVGVASGDFGDLIAEPGPREPAPGPIPMRGRRWGSVAIALALAGLVVGPVLAVIAQVTSSSDRSPDRVPLVVQPNASPRRITRTVPLGSQVIADEGFSLRVADYQPAAAGQGPLGRPAPGTTFAVANVEVCLPAGSTPVAFSAFALSLRDGARLRPDITARPQGVAEGFRLAKPDECTNGSLVFEVPTDAIPTAVKMETAVVVRSPSSTVVRIDIEWRLPG